MSCRYFFRSGPWQIIGIQRRYSSAQAFLPEPTRYSEDIDTVQVNPEPIGLIFDALRKVLKYLGKAKVAQKNRNNAVTFVVQSTMAPVVPIKIKIEINCREHIDVLGPTTVLFSVESGWFNGESRISPPQPYICA